MLGAPQPPVPGHAADQLGTGTSRSHSLLLVMVAEYRLPKMLISSSLEPGKVTLDGKRDFADVIKSRLFSWGDDLHHPSGPDGIPASLQEGGRR